MKRTFMVGVSAAIIGGLGLYIGGALGMPFSNTIMGVGGGVIAAVVPLGTPLARLGGLLIGLLLGVFFDSMELGLLPGGESVIGSAVALVVVMLVITLVSGLSSGRIPAWSMLLGAVVFVAGFLPVMQTVPWTASQQIAEASFLQLAMVTIGFLAVVPAELWPDKRGPNVGSSVIPSPTSPGDASEHGDTSIHEIMGGAK